MSAVGLLSQGSNPAVNREAASFYSYDISGNVNLLVQQNAALAAKETLASPGSDGLKRIQYEYDLVSGKVNRVKYRDSKYDQFLPAFVLPPRRCYVL